jgi:HKD family nuclease
MQFTVIENSGPNNLRDYLKAVLLTASGIDIAVAFITRTGLREILQLLRQVARKGEVRIITGLYQGFTEPGALRALLRAQDQTKGRLSVRLSTEPGFHRKLYLARNKSKTIAVVGSSNLTKEGLRSSGELNIVLHSTKPLSLRRVSESFEKDWRHRSAQLNLEQIKRYEAHYRKWKSALRSVSVPLRKILQIKSSRKHDTVNPRVRRVWRYSVDGLVRARTEQIIHESTNWDDKGFLWIAAGAHKYQIGDRVLLFDFNDSYASIIEIKDTTEAATPDGRHFFAYSRVPRIPKRKLTKRFFDRLKSTGLISSRVDAHRRRKISEGKWSAFVEMLQAY